jgi:hypothetical protein
MCEVGRFGVLRPRSSIGAIAFQFVKDVGHSLGHTPGLKDRRRAWKRHPNPPLT